MPISISSSGRSKVGVPGGGHDARGQRHAHRAGLALTLTAVAVTSASEPPASAFAPAIFSTRTVPTDAAAAGRVQRVLDGDVVVGHDRRDLDLARDELGRELEVEDVAGVVLDDVEDAGPAVDGPGGGLHLVRHGRGEDMARAGRVEHAQADEPAVERLVAGAAARHQGDLALDRAARPQHDDLVEIDLQDVGVGPAKAGQALGDEVRNVVDELLHAAGRVGGHRITPLLFGEMGAGFKRRRGPPRGSPVRAPWRSPDGR